MGIEEEILAELQAEQNFKAAMNNWCRGSGEDIGKMHFIPGLDEWKIECPLCGVIWHGGSTRLPDHNRPGF